ncbi:MAG TPA: hypothetical protein PK939_06825 [Bacteroidales bacterium]|nr:hypothetical protein [Bacteroidales bacterium]HQQ11589.1 hypothetical protein [Bacteroidales bacterium]
MITRSRFTLILLVMTSLLVGCKSTGPVAKSHNEPVVEDHASRPYAFSTGVFYAFDFNNPAVAGFNEAASLKSLLESGLAVTDVWYKQGSRSCRPPGSDMAMDAIVEPVFLVRMDSANDKLLKMGYLMTKEPGLGDCAYVVRHYKIKK